MIVRFARRWIAATVTLIAVSSRPIPAGGAWGEAHAGGAAPPVARATPARATPTDLERLEALFASGRFDSFAVAVDRAIERARHRGDTALVQRLLVQRARALLVRGHADSASALLHRVAGWARARRDTTLWMSALGFRGMALTALARHDEALAAHRLRLELARRCGDRRSEAWAHAYIGWGLDSQGHPDEAVRHFEAAARVFDELGDRHAEIDVRMGLAHSRESIGDVERARAEFGRVVELADRIGDPRIGAQARQSLAELLARHGNPRRGLDLAVRAFSVLDSTRYTALSMYPLATAARILVALGRRRAALRIVRRAIETCDSLGLVDNATELRIDLGRMELAAGRPASAAALLRGVATDPRATASQRARAVLVRGRALARRSDIDAARRESAAELAVCPPAEPARAELLALDALLAEHAGESERAVSRAREALAAMAGGRLDPRRVRARIALARAFARAGERDSARVHMDIAIASWRSLRASLADRAWLATLDDDLYPDLVDAILMAFSDPRDRLARLRPLRLAAGLADSTREPDRHDAMRRAADGWPVRGGRGDVRIEAFAGRERLAVFAARADTVACAERVRRGVEARFRALRALVATPPWVVPRTERALERAVRATADSVFAGLEPVLDGAESVTFCPDAFLHGLPVDLLVGALVGHCPRTTAVAPSVEAPAHRPDEAAHPTATPPARILVVAPPPDAPLAGARREVSRLRRSLRHVAVARPGGERRAILGADSTVAVLHVASHVTARPEAAWESGIAVAGGPAAPGPHVLGAGVDTLVAWLDRARADVARPELRAGEIAALRLPFRLVVLSGCESAGGRAAVGAGVVGLARAFLEAGAEAVVATLWPVDDAVTAKLIGRFYEGLAEGHSVGEALADARASIRANRATRDPFYWAGFVVVGDAALRVRLERRAHPSGPAALAVALVLLAVTGAGLRRARGRARACDAPRRHGRLPSPRKSSPGV